MNLILCTLWYYLVHYSTENQNLKCALKVRLQNQRIRMSVMTELGFYVTDASLTG
jgi:hypothetical protein